VLQRVGANYTMRKRSGSWKVILTYPLFEDGFTEPDPATAS
jgi:hypothetical protein